MNQPPIVAPNLRRLFLAIAHTTLASGWLAACAEEHAAPDEETPKDGANATIGETSADTGARDSGTPSPARDAGPGLDASAHPTEPVPTPVPPVDAGPGRDAAQLADSATNTAWTPVRCPTAGAEPSEPLKTPQPLASVAVYARQYEQGNSPPLADGGIRHYTHQVAKAGASCGAPPMFDGCSESRKTLIDRACASIPCRFAIIGEGGSDTRIETRDQLLRALGSIDTAAEAVLLAAFDGYHMCPGMQSDPRDVGTEWRPAADGFELQSTWEACGTSLDRRLLSVDAAGKVVVVSQEVLRKSTCAAGRRPPGLCTPDSATGGSEAGKFLAGIAHLEHASIYAFYRLIQELRTLGAPEALRVMALDAMLDEVRHARDMETLARDFGAELIWTEVKETATRSLFEIALDNAREGCVRETFGALLATYQAASAEDRRVQQVMAAIAEDETRHATLSWKLMAWLTPLLSEREQAEVRAAQGEAQAELAQELESALPEPIRRTLGMPSPAVAALLLQQMSRALPN
jgi:hypothetical protein